MVLLGQTRPAELYSTAFGPAIVGADRATTGSSRKALLDELAYLRRKRAPRVFDGSSSNSGHTAINARIFSNCPPFFRSEGITRTCVTLCWRHSTGSLSPRLEFFPRSSEITIHAPSTTLGIHSGSFAPAPKSALMCPISTGCLLSSRTILRNASTNGAPVFSSNRNRDWGFTQLAAASRCNVTPLRHRHGERRMPRPPRLSCPPHLPQQPSARR